MHKDEALFCGIKFNTTYIECVCYINSTINLIIPFATCKNQYIYQT